MLSRGFRTFVRKVLKRTPNMKHISVFYQNVRGLRSKTSTFYNNLLACPSEMVALTETFLTSSVSNAELFPTGYVVLRRDRGNDVGWGGVLLAVRDCY